MNLNLCPTLLLLLFPFSKSSYTHSWQRQETPVDVMTDVVNDLGLKVLTCYSSHPHGNVAFSPTGLAFVLSALYEAAAGNTRHQIAQALGLPQDKRITRIGLRDIHRRLRNYLNPNAFLGGLTLNRDDISLRPEYEDLLRFYGFDLVNASEANATAAPPANATSAPNLASDAADQQNSTSRPTNTSNINPEIEILTNQTDLEGNSTDLTENTTILPTEMTELPTAAANLSAEATTMLTESGNVTVAPVDPTVASIEAQNLTAAARKRRSDENLPAEESFSTEISGEDLESWFPVKFSLLPLFSPDATELPKELTELPTELTKLPTDSSSTPKSAVSVVETSKLQINSTTLPSEQKTTSSSQFSPLKSFRLPSKSPTLLTESTTLPSKSTTLPLEASKKRRSTNPDFQNWLPINPWQPDLDVDGIAVDFDTTEFKPSELNFFTDGVDSTSISTVRYTTVLPFCYFPALGTAAVEFPLDDPRYTVVILLPDRDPGTLVKTLRAFRVKLRKLRHALTPCWVQAAIPSFMLKGFVTLTGWLQKLGVVDAFEPRTADLSVMTPDLGVYARDVHQSIGVNIRNFEPEGANDTVGENPRGEPIPFIADRPFIFFIIDTETSVALIAGRVNDPLNSRII